jgi:hypothetical protein
MRGSANRGGGSRFLYEPFDGAADPEQEEYRGLLRSMGTPEQVRRKLEAIEELLEEKRRRDWLFGSVKKVAGWAAVVAGGWLAFKGLLAEFLMDIQK